MCFFTRAANDFHGAGEIQVGSGGGKCGSCRGCGGAGGGDDDDDNDDDDDDDDGNVSSREDRKRKAPRGKPINLGPIKLVRGGGWCRKAMALASANSVL